MWARVFDTSRLESLGEPVPLAEHVGSSLAFGFFASTDSALVYRNGLGETRRLTWFDRHGKRSASVGEPVILDAPPVLSPDGTRVAMATFDAGSIDVWVYDLARDVSQRLTFDPALDTSPIWSHDGKRVAFCSSRAGHYDVFQISSASANSEELLFGSGENKCPTSWSSDGRFLARPTGR